MRIGSLGQHAGLRRHRHGKTEFSRQPMIAGRNREPVPIGIGEARGPATGDRPDAFGGGCRELNLDQMSAWVLPDEAVPESVASAFPGGDVSPFEATLYR